MVQQPLNPGVLEAARQLLYRTALRWPEALQLGSVLEAREMFPGTKIVFVSASVPLREAARAEGIETIDPAQLPPVESAQLPTVESERSSEAELASEAG